MKQLIYYKKQAERGKNMCTQAMLTEILDKVVLFSKDIFKDKLTDVILFGSYARGDFDEESDIDILIVANLPSEEIQNYRDRLDSICGEMLFDYGVLVSIIEKDYDTYNRYADILPFYKNIVKEGVKIA